MSPPLRGRRFKWIIAVCAVSACLATAAPVWLVAWRWPADRAAGEARRALSEGRYRDAWRIADRWVKERPGRAEFHFLRARSALALGRTADVVAGLKRARALGYPDEPLQVIEALIDAQYGRMARARPVLARAFIEPHDPDPMLDEALTRIYLEIYDFPHAGPVLDRWAADAPGDPRPPLWHAAVHRRCNAEPELIIADYREALRRSPANAEALIGLATQLQEDHREAEAADAFARYLALRPDDPSAHLGAGRNAAERGDADAAIRHIDRVLELDPDNAEAHLERGKLDLRRGDPAAALGHLERAAELAPFDPVAQYQRSLALGRLGRRTEAAAAQRRFDALQQARLELEGLQQDLAASPKDPDLQGRVARWMFEHGYDDEALLWSRRILVDTPGHPETCRLLADYYEKHGQFERAREYRERVDPGRKPPTSRPSP